MEYSGLNYELINGLQEISFCLYLLQYERDKFIHILFGLGSSHSSHIELADGTGNQPLNWRTLWPWPMCQEHVNNK